MHLLLATNMFIKVCDWYNKQMRSASSWFVKLREVERGQFEIGAYCGQTLQHVNGFYISD